MPKSETGYPSQVKKFLHKYYKEYGVGRTLGQKLSHWRKQAEADNRQGERFDTEEDLSAIEVTNLLADEFPQLWPSC